VVDVPLVKRSATVLVYLLEKNAVHETQSHVERNASQNAKNARMHALVSLGHVLPLSKMPISSVSNWNAFVTLIHSITTLFLSKLSPKLSNVWLH
jgi:hypothetical protein